MSAGLPPRRRPWRRRDARHQWELHFGPNMTPMVDVVMVILIFFMASTAVVGSEWMLRVLAGRGMAREAFDAAHDPFELPRPRFRLELRLGPGGVTRVSGLGLVDATLEQLDAHLAEFARRVDPGAILLVVSPAADVPYADVVRVRDRCGQVGMEAVALAGPGV